MNFSDFVECNNYFWYIDFDILILIDYFWLIDFDWLVLIDWLMVHNAKNAHIHVYTLGGKIHALKNCLQAYEKGYKMQKDE